MERIWQRSMAFVDTNILLRWLLQDDPRQCQLADQIITSAAPNSLIITDIVASEVSYILRIEKMQCEVIADSIQALHKIDSLFFEHEVLMGEVLTFYRTTSLDFADCYLLARSLRENKGLKTLDKPLQKTYNKLYLRC